MSYGSHTIYLDHAATTPVRPDVVESMLPYFTERFGNPSSIYQLGQEARAALDEARRRISTVLHSRPSEVVLTSGATESIGLALRGVAWWARLSGSGHPHIVSTTIEHHAALHTLDALQRQGFQVSLVPVDERGLVDPEAVAAAIRPDTCLISVMYANNEIGSIQPIAEIGRIAKRRGIPFHTDAVQAAGACPLDVQELGVDLLSLSAHKFYGPKGVGALFVRKGTRLEWQQEGGGQESGRRGGTENVPLIVGMGRALEIAERDRMAYVAHTSELRDRLWQGISERIDGVHLSGPDLSGPRLPNNLNIAIGGVQGETVLLSLDMEGVAASAGSACTTGNSEPSHVLLAMGQDESTARTSLRLTVGLGNSLEEMDATVGILAGIVDRVRALGAVNV